MSRREELHELKVDIERSFSAALFSMDYTISQIILDASKAANKACAQQDYQSA